jgi:hypothetical protein
MDLSNANDAKKAGSEVNEKWVLWWKPFWITFGLAPLGLIAIIGQIWLPRLNSLMPDPLDKVYISIMRIVLFILGAFLLMISSPVYHPASWRPGAEDDETEGT